MTVFEFHDEVLLPHPREEVFAFFSDAYNLDALTPEWLHFHIITPRPINIREGALIDYRLKLHGIPIGWRTRICEWDPPHRFVDEQIRGPYRLWHHTHTFEERGGGTLVTDHVRYAVWGGGLVNRFFVRGDVERIFRHRRETLLAMFPPA